MELVLNEEQTMLAKTADDFIKGKSPVARMRKLRDDKDPLGYSKEVWKQMADLGWMGIPFSEKDGGLGLGMADVVLITEAMGKNLAPEPYISTVMLAGQAIALSGSKKLRDQWLAPIIAGDKVLTVGYQEKGGRYDIYSISTKAKKTAGGYVLNGVKAQVMDGYGADAIIVSARTSGRDGDANGITLFLIPQGTKGMTVTRQWRLDSKNTAIVKLKNVTLPLANIVGKVGQGGKLLGRVIDCATVALCGEMLGGMSVAFNSMLAYMKERVQYDVLIGTFQALKHRAARMYMEVELTRSVVMAAARAIDEKSKDGDLLISTAKARCSDAYIAITNEAVQIFGGIGMTDEMDIGFYMKRARTAEMTFGDAAYHRDRFATLKGY